MLLKIFASSHFCVFWFIKAAGGMRCQCFFTLTCLYIDWRKNDPDRHMVT